MPRTWIIGNAGGSIGETVQRSFRIPVEGIDRSNTGLAELPEYEEAIGTGTDVDVTKPDELEDFALKYGPFKNVVYCAGVASLQWIKDLQPQEYQRVFGVNIFGFFNVMKVLTNTQTEGNVVVLVSDSSHVAMRGSMSYCASKAALHQAVRVAARELAPAWRINGVSPSIVDGTRMTEYIDETVPGFRGWDPDTAKAYENALVPIGRRATKKEVAHVIIDVMQGPEFMTGTIVEMTGGK